MSERRKIWLSLLAAVALAALAGALCGCSKTVYVPLETVRTETQYNDRWSVDTVFRDRDRIVFVRGDTVYDKSTEYVYRVREVHDSIYIARTDSVQVPVPVEVPVEVERSLSWWERFRLGAFGWMAAALALCAGWTLRRPLLALLRSLIG